MNKNCLGPPFAATTCTVDSDTSISESALTSLNYIVCWIGPYGSTIAVCINDPWLPVTLSQVYPSFFFFLEDALTQSSSYHSLALVKMAKIGS